MKRCPKCGAVMTIGAAHDMHDAYQYECRCGYILRVPLASYWVGEGAAR